LKSFRIGSALPSDKRMQRLIFRTKGLWWLFRSRALTNFGREYFILKT